MKALKAVQIVYPAARLKVAENGLVLLPSPPHIAPATEYKSKKDDDGQPSLF